MGDKSAKNIYLLERNIMKEICINKIPFFFRCFVVVVVAVEFDAGKRCMYIFFAF